MSYANCYNILENTTFNENEKQIYYAYDILALELNNIRGYDFFMN